jgi:ribosomal protein L29
MKIKQIRENSSEEIRALIQESEKEMLGMKVKKAAADGSTQPLKIRTVRRAVARMQTVIREREIKNND